MKLSTRSRYGLRLMIDLYENYTDTPLFLKDIAGRQGLSEKYLSKLIIPLKSAGLINSIRGASGGYIPSKKPTDIKLIDIIKTLEGELSIVDCVHNKALCDQTAECRARLVWHKVESLVSNYLGSVTLEDILNESMPGEKPIS